VTLSVLGFLFRLLCSPSCSLKESVALRDNGTSLLEHCNCLYRRVTYRMMGERLALVWPRLPREGSPCPFGVGAA
jgi:hypothetical protein